MRERIRIRSTERAKMSVKVVSDIGILEVIVTAVIVTKSVMTEGEQG